MKSASRLLFALCIVPLLGLSAGESSKTTACVPTDQIQLRDPFVLPVPQEGMYYLFGTTDKNCWGAGTGFDTYRSKDLALWEGPLPAFRPPSGFWADQNFWAPEAYSYKGAWYLFASFKAAGHARGTQILKAAHPEGPYLPLSSGPLTPSDWECLDGTLFVETSGKPWMIFCHEWVQVGDGEICAMPLTSDLSKADGKPVVLFRASEASWSSAFRGDKHVTDGPFLHRTKSGRLLMLWSTIGPEGYTLGYAFSSTGDILGPWVQAKTPLFGRDGGHGMIFRSFGGGLFLTLHHPNKSPNERARFIPIEETPEGDLRLLEAQDAKVP
jgi:hypothetical protein